MVTSNIAFLGFHHLLEEGRLASLPPRGQEWAGAGPRLHHHGALQGQPGQGGGGQASGESGQGQESLGRQERVAGTVERRGQELGPGQHGRQEGDGAALHARRGVLDRVLHRLLQRVRGTDHIVQITSIYFCSQEVSICTLGPDFDKDGTVDVAKHIRIVYGEVKRLLICFIRSSYRRLFITFQWIAGESAGGCRNDLKLFSTNPQFLLTIHPV